MKNLVGNEQNQLREGQNLKSTCESHSHITKF